MKITTQRTALWMANLAVFAAMFGLILIIWKNDSRARWAVEEQADRNMKDQLAKVKAPKRSASEGRKDVLDVVIKGNFSGYIPPKKVEVKPRNTGPEVAPDLSTLLTVLMVVAPQYDSKGSLTNVERHGAMVNIKGVSQERGIFRYREGDVIGIKEGFDLEPTLKKFGGALVERVTIDGLRCLWAKKSVEVTLNGHGEPQGITLEGGGISKGVISSGSASDATAPNLASLGTFRSGAGRSRIDYMTFSREGVQALEGGGQAILDGVAFDTTKGPDGKDALKIKSIPPQLSEYGLQSGDVIVRIDSQPVTSKESIVQYVKSTYQRKRSYRVVYLRSGAERQLSVTVPRDLNRARQMGGRLSGARFGR